MSSSPLSQPPPLSTNQRPGGILSTNERLAAGVLSPRGGRPLMTHPGAGDKTGTIATSPHRHIASQSQSEPGGGVN